MIGDRAAVLGSARQQTLTAMSGGVSFSHSGSLLVVAFKLVAAVVRRSPRRALRRAAIRRQSSPW